MSTSTQNQTTETARTEYLVPRANLRQDEQSYVLEIEMPGVGKDAVDIAVDDGQLVITGQRSAPADLGRPVYRERRAVSYRRAFQLDPSLDVNQISAQLDQGLLTLRLQKPAPIKPHKITIS